MSEMNEAALRRKKRRKRQMIGQYMLSFMIIVLTGLNVGFGAINLQKIKDQRAGLYNTDPGNPELPQAPLKETEAEVPKTEPTAENAGSETEVPQLGEDKNTEPQPGEGPGLTVPNGEAAYKDPRFYLVGYYENMGVISNPTGFVNIRSEASANAPIVGKAPAYSAFEILEESGDFYKIAAGGCEGYVARDFVYTGDEALTVAMQHCSANAYALYDRTKAYERPNTASKEQFEMYADNGYELLERVGNWVRIVTNTGLYGYVNEDKVSVRYTLVEPYFYEEAGKDLSRTRLDLIDYAFQWYGGAYVWGSATLGEGVDCSGYVLRVFEHFGYNVPRLSIEQSVWGKEVASMADIKAGDLLFFRGYYDNGTLSEGVGHVGIYIGNGKMIHAASKERGITVDAYNYMEEPICIRRYIND